MSCRGTDEVLQALVTQTGMNEVNVHPCHVERNERSECGTHVMLSGMNAVNEVETSVIPADSASERQKKDVHNGRKLIKKVILAETDFPDTLKTLKTKSSKLIIRKVDHEK